MIESNNTDVTVLPNEISFTDETWDMEQTVNVAVGSDTDAFNDKATLSHSTSGGGYGSGENRDFIVSVNDDEVAGLTVRPTTTVTVMEGGSGNDFMVRLNTQPVANVKVTASSNNAAATFTPLTRTFTSGNWNIAQTFTVRGAQDDDPLDATVTATFA